METTRRLLLGLLSLVLLAGMATLGGTALAGPGISLERFVISGGGSRLQNGGMTLDYTLGQPVVGTNTNGEAELCTGFWCKAGAGLVEHQVFIPMVLKN